MALILRTCIHRQSRPCLEQLILGRNVTRNSNIKRFAPTLQGKRFSTESDKKCEQLQLVYVGNLSKRIFHVRVFSLLTTLGSMLGQPYFYMRALATDNILAIAAVVPLFLIFGIGTPVLLHFITRSYVINMYYNSKEDKYVISTFNFFARTKQMEFTPKDVVLPNIDRMFASCLIKGKPIYFCPDNFTEFDHYMKIMSFDKPIDFKLDDNNNRNKMVTEDSREKK